jgi:hypothetical protein
MNFGTIIAGLSVGICLASATSAQSIVTNAPYGALRIVDAATGRAHDIPPPVNGSVWTVIGVDANTGIIYANGQYNNQMTIWSIDPVTGLYTKVDASSDDSYNVWDGRVISSRVTPAWTQELISAEADAASSLAGVLDIAAPGIGQSNFVNMTADTIGDSNAFGVSYARNSGRWRLGAAYARNDRGDDAGKVSAGFGW